MVASLVVRTRASAAVLSALIAIADVAQPLLLPWRSKFVFALLGALLYSFVAGWLALGRSRTPLIIVALMPVVPLGSLALSLAGLPVPADAAMLWICSVQTLASLCAIAALLSQGSPAKR